MTQRDPNIEKELLLQVSQGGDQAFSRLFHQYHHQLAAYINHLTGSADTTEEVVQDVFMKIWVNRIALAEVTDFRAWLFAISKNHAINCLKKMATERLQQKEWSRLQAITGEGDSTGNEYQHLLIEKAIQQLPPQQKKVFVLSKINRLKYEEIATRLNLSRETVKSYIALAKTSINKFVSSNSPFFITLYVITKIIF